MRILFLGDVVGKAGRSAVAENLPQLRADLALDFVVVNGENASHFRGLTEEHYTLLRNAGADVVTLGDHAFDQKDAMTYLPREQNIVRPINWGEGTPGRGVTLVESEKGHRVLVINAMGRTFMKACDDPFRAVEKAVADCPMGQVADAIIVDFHAEATSEMQAMGHFLDGKVSLVVGTHTHIPTADHRVLKDGTGLMSDAGMCGDYDSVIGVVTEEPLNRFLTGMTTGRFEPASGPASLSGVVVETDPSTGLCSSIQPLRMGGSLQEIMPVFSD